MRNMRLLAFALVAAVVSCAREPDPVAQSGKTSGVSGQPLTDADIPTDSLGASIRRGLALILHTPDSLPDYAPGNITCGNCHLQGGRNPDAVPLIGSHVRFPKYLDRSGAVVALADRVNYCVTRSLAGNKLPVDSREMQDMLAYIAWLSRGVAVGDGEQAPGAMGLPSMPITLRGDRSQGEKVYQAKCVACHLPTGEGVPTAKPAIPALWGPKSFSIGASMARESKAASFIWHNMPLGLGKSLTPKEAYDVAAYITSKPRPDSPGKENDWPGGGAPSDVPYATRGHSAYNPPPLLPRATPTRTIVSAPKRAQSR
jgi:thiosulfate dehydrogenase